METLRKRIEGVIGGSLNITKCIQKENVLFYSIKDQTLVHLSKLNTLKEIESVELKHNKLKILLTNENKEKNDMAKVKENFNGLAKLIVKNVGGKENIKSIRHCITRVRFVLQDESKANDDVLNNTEGIISVVKSGGEYMVVIGNHVVKVYDAVCDVLGISDGIVSKEKESGASQKKQNVVMRVLNVVVGAIGPALNYICAGGVLKGLLAVLTLCGLQETDGVYMLLNAMGDAIFYFLPLFLGYNMAKSRGADGLLGLFIGAMLLYPSINGVDVNIFGYVVNASYTSSFLPIVLVVALAAPLYNFLKDRIPAIVSGFLTPVLTALIAFPIGFILIGPAANLVGQGVNDFISMLMNTVPLLGGIVFAGLYQVLVLFGVHSAVTSFSFMNVLSGNPDVIMALGCYCSFAQIGVVLAMYLKTKNQKLKSVALPAFISGIFGVTEPAIYGVTLPRIKMFVISCIGAAIGGAFVMLAGITMYSFTGLGIVTILGMVSPENPNFINAILGAIVPFVASFIMAFIVFKDDKLVEKTTTTIDACVDGDIIPLSNVADETFASGMMGKGIAVEPKDGKVYAPFDGTCVMMFDTLHALGLKSNDGIELLVHVGINTVGLDGKPFIAHVQSGETIKKGQLLLEFDIDAIKEAGLAITTPIIVTNESEIGSVEIKNNKIIVKQGGK